MSTKPFTNCLWFDGQAEDAANHYCSIFKDGKIQAVNRFSEAGPASAGDVMTVAFRINGQDFVGLNGGPEFKFNESISFMVHCADQEEVDLYWERLSEGGTEGPCGWLKDKFGVSWQVIPEVLFQLINDPDPAKASRASQAMFSMQKIDIDALVKAHAGQ